MNAIGAGGGGSGAGGQGGYVIAQEVFYNIPNESIVGNITNITGNITNMTIETTITTSEIITTTASNLTSVPIVDNLVESFVPIIVLAGLMGFIALIATMVSGTFPRERMHGSAKFDDDEDRQFISRDVWRKAFEETVGKPKKPYKKSEPIIKEERIRYKTKIEDKKKRWERA